MKKFIGLILFISILFSSPVYADWELLSASNLLGCDGSYTHMIGTNSVSYDKCSGEIANIPTSLLYEMWCEYEFVFINRDTGQTKTHIVTDGKISVTPLPVILIGGMDVCSEITPEKNLGPTCQ